MSAKAQAASKAKESATEAEELKVAESVNEIEDETQTPETTDAKTDQPEKFAKAGKRSKKTIEEEKAEFERQERKLDRKEAEESGESEIKKGPKPVTRPLIERRGKKYQAAAQKVEKGKSYPLAEAIKLAIETSTVEFDPTVEIHVRLNVDPRQADQNIRATVSLPNGNGKKIRVAAFVADDQIKLAQDAGADLAGENTITDLLAKERLDFDILITTPAMMPKLGKYARLLGPKGLMPNPKAGTVATNVTDAIKESKAGKVEYRVDKQSILHLGIGKLSFGTDKLQANADALLDSLKSQKPASVKGVFVRSIAISTTMGPGIKVENTLN